MQQEHGHVFDEDILPADILRQTTIILLRWRPLFDLIRNDA